MSRGRKTPSQEASERWPGSSRPFAIAGESAVGAFLLLASVLLVITVALGLLLATQLVVRRLAGDTDRLAGLRADLRAGWLGGLGVGVLYLAVVLLLSLDITIGTNADLPFAGAVVVIGWVGLVLVTVGLVIAAGSWTPETRWRGAIRAVPRNAASDPVGALLVAIAVGITGFLAAWYLPFAVIGFIGVVFISAVLVVRRVERAARRA